MGVTNFLSNYQLWGNSGYDYLLAIVIFLGVALAFKFVDLFLINIFKKAAKKTKLKIDDVIVDFLSSIRWPFFVYMGFYFSLKTLTLPVLIGKGLFYLLVVFIAYYASKGLITVVDHFVKEEVVKREQQKEPENTSMIKVFGTILKIGIWSIALLMVLTNLGIEITPLVAGLGVGGIAIAIALQAVLSDLFAAFAIYFDKPFKEGDFIIVGNDMGTVKHIGIKTTRIQSLGGQELIISNSDLTNSRVNNYKRMQKRRIVFSFGVEYSTPLKKLKKINEIVKKIIKEIKDADLDRVHFCKFGDFSINYEVVYYVNSPDYNRYMDVQQDINFNLKEAFEKEKIVFAFPTQTVFLEKGK